MQGDELINLMKYSDYAFLSILLNKWGSKYEWSWRYFNLYKKFSNI